jgi:proline dehydrogenase
MESIQEIQECKSEHDAVEQEAALVRPDVIAPEDAEFSKTKVGKTDARFRIRLVFGHG